MVGEEQNSDAKPTEIGSDGSNIDQRLLSEAGHVAKSDAPSR